MKEEILKRAMFAMPLSKEAQSTGIMSGFDMDDMEDDVDENADMEDMPPMARTPQNPEILMNTLRGDMRSVDARYMELAQMVGEEAAMETPPEVLAMLMGKLGAQQGGIGALPQGQEMMPPPMPGEAPTGAAPGGQMPPPDQMGAQEPAPAMPQGGIPMPEGMESAPPFSQGAEAPQGYAIGGIVRGAQMVGDKLGQYGSAANAALGRMFMSPQGITQPFVESVRGPGGRFTAEQINRGGDLITPTFTQGITQGILQGTQSGSRLAEQYPRVAKTIGSAAAVLGMSNLPSGSSDQSDMGSSASQIPTDTAEERAAGRAIRDASPPAVTYDISDADPTNWRQQQRGKPPGPIPMAGPTAEVNAADMRRLLGNSPAPQAAAPEKDVSEFIEEKIDAQKDNKAVTLAKDLKAAGKQESKIDRIRKSQAEYAPLYEELLGGDKESAKINALLLLSEAGLKLASTRKPTFAMALADAASGLPRGFAAIAAQDRELGMKVKTASLQQAISDVDSQDKYAQALQLQVLKGDYDLLKEQAKQGGGVTEDAGMGYRITKNKQGSYMGGGIDPNDPTVRSAIDSPFTLRQTDNPYVENMGEAPTAIVTDKAGRLELGGTLAAYNNSLKSIEIAKNSLSQLYSPGTFFVDKINNLIVPIDFTGAVKPDLNQEAAKTTLMTLQNTLSKSIASANNSGRTAVQEQEWARQLTEAIANPTGFFKDRELAAKTLTAIETSIRNSRQETLTQLGFEKNDYVMRTPNTGTKNDPFVISSDPAQQKPMFTFLGRTVGKLQDPRAVVHLRMPNGTVQQFSPTQLRALNQ